MAYEYTVPRRIFELKREEVTGGWKQLQKEGLHNSIAQWYSIGYGLDQWYSTFFTPYP
jgi:hypothetical protein